MESTPGLSISLSLRMAKALSLARVGKLRDAQAMIAGDRAIPEHPIALEALAALVTSEGDYLRALKLWELLLQRDPHHPEARRMVSAIELWLSRPSWMRYLPLATATIVALLVAGFLWAIVSTSEEPSPKPRTSPAAVGSPVARPPAQATPVQQTAPALTPRPAPPPTVTFPPSGTTQRRRNGK